MGWTLWHATRVEDGIIANISGKPQVWIEGSWHQKFDMPADPSKSGIGDSLEQVAAFKPTAANLLGYAEAVREKTLACLNTLTPADLDGISPLLAVAIPEKLGPGSPSSCLTTSTIVVRSATSVAISPAKAGSRDSHASSHRTASRSWHLVSDAVLLEASL